MVVEKSTINKKKYLLSKKPHQKTNGADMLREQERKDTPKTFG
jgi:hypothetical protein